MFSSCAPIGMCEHKKAPWLSVTKVTVGRVGVSEGDCKGSLGWSVETLL